MVLNLTAKLHKKNGKKERTKGNYGKNSAINAEFDSCPIAMI